MRVRESLAGLGKANELCVRRSRRRLRQDSNLVTDSLATCCLEVAAAAAAAAAVAKPQTAVTTRAVFLLLRRLFGLVGVFRVVVVGIVCRMMVRVA